MELFTGEFTLPRLERVIAGGDILHRVGHELDRYGCRRALVVTGTTVAASPLLARTLAALGPRSCGVFSGARQHVPSQTVRQLVAAMRDARADALVSLGGGSPIDTAKGAVHAVLRETGAGDREPQFPVHIAVPTTLSAGEFTDVAGVTDETTRVKHAVFDTRLAPRTVIADAAAAEATPDWLWAASGIRALDHAIETLYSSRPHPISVPLASRAIEMLRAHLPASIDEEGASRRAHRGACQLAAWLSVFGVTNAGFGLSHVIGHQIGPRWDVPHGMTSAVVLPHAMRFMAEAAPERFAHIAAVLDVPYPAGDARRAAQACADATAAFIARLGLPGRLRDVNVPRGPFVDIAEVVCDAMGRSGVVERAVTVDEVASILEGAY